MPPPPQTVISVGSVNDVENYWNANGKLLMMKLKSWREKM
jgi:hypothetical protein